LLDHLRQHLSPDTQISLHTNGRLALKKIDVLNQYDRVCISLPTFDPTTYVRMMGVRGVPDLAHIVDRAQIPIKVSCLIDEHNYAELPQFLARCHAIGIKRLVLRRLYGDQHPWNLPADLLPHGDFHGNPIYAYHMMEVTLWNFDQCDCTSLNLFSDGTISADYLLAKAYYKAPTRL
jgi:hypothetical protein